MADKVIKKMAISKQTEKKIVKHGFINDIARACGCSRHTVRTAIYDNAAGEKADKVRKYYKARYKEIVVR